MWPFTLSGRLPIVALVSLYLTNKLMGRKLIPGQSQSSFHNIIFKKCYFIRYYLMFPWAIPVPRADHLRVTHPFATLYSASTVYRSTCMLKTRRQRSFWARIKLSIIYSIAPKRDSFIIKSSLPALSLQRLKLSKINFLTRFRSLLFVFKDHLRF